MCVIGGKKNQVKCSRMTEDMSNLLLVTQCSSCPGENKQFALTMDKSLMCYYYCTSLAKLQTLKYCINICCA